RDILGRNYSHARGAKPSKNRGGGRGVIASRTVDLLHNLPHSLPALRRIGDYITKSRPISKQIQGRLSAHHPSHKIADLGPLALHQNAHPENSAGRVDAS